MDTLIRMYQPPGLAGLSKLTIVELPKYQSLKWILEARGTSLAAVLARARLVPPFQAPFDPSVEPEVVVVPTLPFQQMAAPSPATPPKKVSFAEATVMSSGLRAAQEASQALITAKASASSLASSGAGPSAPVVTPQTLFQGTNPVRFAGLSSPGVTKSPFLLLHSMWVGKILPDPTKSSAPPVEGVVVEVIWPTLGLAGFTGAPARFDLASSVERASPVNKKVLHALPMFMESFTRCEDEILRLAQVMLISSSPTEARVVGASHFLAFWRQLRAQVPADKGDGKSSMSMSVWKEIAVHILASWYWYCISGEEVYLVVYNPAATFSEFARQQYMNPDLICFVCGDFGHTGQSSSCPKKKGSGSSSSGADQGNGATKDRAKDRDRGTERHRSSPRPEAQEAKRHRRHL